MSETNKPASRNVTFTYILSYLLTVLTDEQRRGFLPTLPYLQQPVRPETERRMAIRHTDPKKALVEAETSTITK